jgi:phosphohistidine phosphatase
MRTLYLSRHAKAEKGFDGISDFDRPLNNRGIIDAANMGKMLKQKNIIPALFISSPAIRALSTAFIFAREMGYPWNRIKIDENIYEASTDELLQVIKGVSDELGSVMLFGHNPAFTDAANALTAGTFDNVPTAGVVCMDFEVQSWREIAPGIGKLRSFDTPKGSAQEDH